MKQKLRYRYSYRFEQWSLQHPEGMDFAQAQHWLNRQVSLGALYYLRCSPQSYF